MMKYYCAALAFVCLFLSSSTTLYGAQTSSTDEEKMQELRAMFSSPYQEEDYFRTDRLLVTATGSQKPVRLAPSVASIITSEKIEEIGTICRCYT